LKKFGYELWPPPCLSASVVPALTGEDRAEDMPMIKVLILDDRDDYLRALKGALRKEFAVITAQSIEKARELLDDTTHAVLIDVRLSEEDESNRDGLIFLRWAKARFPEIPMLMMSAYTDFDSAVEANNSGASYFLKKPIDLPELKELLRRFGTRKNSARKDREYRQGQESD